MILKGAAEIHSQGTAHYAREGDFFVFDPYQPHELRAVGEAVRILSMQNTPITSLPTFRAQAIAVCGPQIQGCLFDCISYHLLTNRGERSKICNAKNEWRGNIEKK